MQKLKDYTGSVYGGLAHLLYDFYQAQKLSIPEHLYQIQNVERFDYLTWRDLLGELNLQLKRPALGLEIAAYVQPRHLGIIAYLAMSCDNLGEALLRYHDFHRLIYDGSPLHLEVRQDYIAIRWGELPVNMSTQITDEIHLAILVEFLKHFMNFEDIALYEVQFSHGLPHNTKVYEQYFRCPVKFSQEKTQLLFSIKELETPFSKGDQTLQKLLTQQAQALLAELPNTTQLDQRLQQAILKGLQKNLFQIEHIAKQLNLPVRQLQRHLQQQSTTYQKRMQEVRYMLAEQYLSDPHLSLQEIALLLGYSEQSAFQRAFKQWRAITPQQWRSQYSESVAMS